MIKLENVSKYYASEDAVAIGIRRVSLELNIGEFVAVTGESGSGKSTFLNVISGIDSYEEGELIVNGEETSGYIQPDWEKFRNDYISFVFQEYNIIDSYTVLQNVEIALINRFPDKKERRKQALELIDKVGLTSHVKHKGTKLSGGQKQRVVIARALAKDSPVIMADEPTGNLDSVTGKEILALLAEMAKDRLIIVVTHNYEEVEPYATRKIRFFDGEVVEDRQVKQTETTERAQVKRLPKLPAKKNAENVLGIAANNLLSTPKKTTFLTALMASLVIVLLLGAAMFDVISNYTSTNFKTIYRCAVENRLVIKKQDGSIFSAADMAKLNDIVGEDNLIYEDLPMDCYWWIYQKDEYSATSQITSRAQLLPMSALKQSVQFGRAGEAYDEVVISNNYANKNYNYVGEEGNLSVLINNYGTFFNSKSLAKVKCVGHTKILNYSYNDLIFVSDALYKDLTNEALFSAVSFTYVYGEKQNENYSIRLYSDSSVPLGEAKFIEGKNAESNTIDYTALNGDTQLSFNTPLFSKSFKLNISQADEATVERCYTENAYYFYTAEPALIINPQEVYGVVYGDGYYQVSGFVDKNKQNTAISRLENNGFWVTKTNAPNSKGGGEDEIIGKIINIGYIFIFLGICSLMYRLAFKVSGKVIKSKNRDYVIMRSIGIEKRITTRVLAAELCFISLLSAVLLAVPIQIYKWTVPLNDTGLSQMMYSIDFGCFMLAGISMLVISVLLAFKYSGDMYGDTIKNSLKSK